MVNTASHGAVPEIESVSVCAAWDSNNVALIGAQQVL